MRNEQKMKQNSKNFILYINLYNIEMRKYNFHQKNIAKKYLQYSSSMSVVFATTTIVHHYNNHDYYDFIKDI